MKKIVMTMVALLTLTAAVAQNSDNQQRERRAPKQPTAEEMTTRMAKDLNLTDEQKAKVQALNAEYKDVLAGPRMGRGGHRGGPRPDGETGATQQQDKKADKKQEQQKADKKGERPERPQLTDEQKAQMKQQMEKRREYDTKLKQILTDEQYKKFQQHHQRRGGRGGFPGGQRGQRGPRQQQD